MKTLRELAESKSERVRLQAAMRMSEILLEHTRLEERLALARERNARLEAEARAAQPSSPPAPPEPTKEELDARRAKEIYDTLKAEIDARRNDREQR